MFFIRRTLIEALRTRVPVHRITSLASSSILIV